MPRSDTVGIKRPSSENPENPEPLTRKKSRPALARILDPQMESMASLVGKDVDYPWSITFVWGKESTIPAAIYTLCEELIHEGLGHTGGPIDMANAHVTHDAGFRIVLQGTSNINNAQKTALRNLLNEHINSLRQQSIHVQIVADGAAAQRRRQIDKVARMKVKRRQAQFRSVDRRKDTVDDIEQTIFSTFPDAGEDDVEKFAQQLEARYRPEIPTEKQIIDEFIAKPMEKETSIYDVWSSDPSERDTLEGHRTSNDYTWDPMVSRRQETLRIRNIVMNSFPDVDSGKVREFSRQFSEVHWPNQPSTEDILYTFGKLETIKKAEIARLERARAQRPIAGAVTNQNQNMSSFTYRSLH